MRPGSLVLNGRERSDPGLFCGGRGFLSLKTVGSSRRSTAITSNWTMLCFYYIVHPLQTPGSGTVAALDTPALGGPCKEAPKSRAFAPHQAEEFAGPERVLVPARKCFQAPAKVRTRPRSQPVALGRDPVVAQSRENQDGYFQPSRSRRHVMCATWWRPCQAYRPTMSSSVIAPRSGCLKRRAKSSERIERSNTTQRS
jgi:hypothetical protein